MLPDIHPPILWTATGIVLGCIAVAFYAGFLFGRLDREEARINAAAARAREIMTARLHNQQRPPAADMRPIPDPEPAGQHRVSELPPAPHLGPTDIDLGVMQPVGDRWVDPASTWWHKYLARNWREGGTR